MLDPRDRQLLLEALRPPDGYRLSGAVGTSFTLDLIALLTAPLAFTLHDWEDDEGGTVSSPLALLESVRRHAAKITLFCQAGEIKVPPPVQRLIAYLEPCIAEVNAPHPAGVFHPKIWLLRFTRQDEPVRYRFLCLSRNLTFDKCWDSILSLDGELIERRNAFAANRPLGDFIASLPSMAIRPLSDSRNELVTRMSEEVRRVRFDLPDGVESVAFWPMGFDNRNRWPFVESRRPMLVVSPFLSVSLLSEVIDGRTGCILVSRADELAQLPTEVASLFGGAVYAMDPVAEDVSGSELAGPGLSGLHAKLFVEDDGWNASVYTGSANATDAGFNRNVEFLVQLRGRRSELGIDAFLGEGTSENGFRRLLVQWHGRQQELSPADQVREALEQRLASIRRKIASLPLSVRCAESDGGRFALELESTEPLKIDTDVAFRCWPSSLRYEDARVPANQPGMLATFGPLSGDAITSFFAFELEARESDVTVTSRFVLSLPLQGAPSDRLERLLASQLKDQEHVLRFLWLLLQAEMSASDASELALSIIDSQRSGQRSLEGYPIFERLVSSLSDSVDRARDVGRVIEDLMRSAEGRSLLPFGLAELWSELKSAIEESHVESA